MRVTMEDCEETDQRHCSQCGQPDSQGHCRSEQKNRQADTNLDKGKSDTSDAETAADDHHADEGCWNQVQGSSTEKKSIEANRHHGQDVVEAAERMTETMCEPLSATDTCVGVGSGSNEDESWDDEWKASCHVRSYALTRNQTDARSS